MMKRTFRAMAVLAAGFCAFSVFSANQVRADLIDYDLSGIFGLRFDSTDNSDHFLLAFGYGAGGPAVNYSFQLNTDTGEGWLFGELTGAVASINNANVALSGNPVTATVNLHYTGLSVGTDPVTGASVIAIGRGGADGTGTIELESDFLGGALTLEFNLEDKFAFTGAPVVGDPHYGNFGQAPFNLIAGLLPGSANDVFKSWVMAQNLVNIFPREYRVEGDFHATITGSSEIPEPATAALLGAGLLGLLRRRKSA